MDATVGLVQALLPVIAHVTARVAAAHPSTRILGTERMGSAVVVESGGLLLHRRHRTVAEELHYLRAKAQAKSLRV